LVSQQETRSCIRNLRFAETHGLPPKIEAPHITLLDTFSSPDRMEKAAKKFREVASSIDPFQITLRTLQYFTHGAKRGYTLYVDPEIPLVNGRNPLLELQRKLHSVCASEKFEMLEFQYPPEKFLPHVSLGKISSESVLTETMKKYSENWEVITCTVTEFSIMSKLVHDTVVRHAIPLGKNPTKFPVEFQPVPFPKDGTYSLNINWVPPGSTDSELLSVFATCGATQAKTVFKNIDRIAFTKGWGQVTFPTKNRRDDALKRKWSLKGSSLECFPCD